MRNNNIDPQNYEFGLKEVWDETSNLNHTIEYPVTTEEIIYFHILSRVYDIEGVQYTDAIEKFIRFSLQWFLEMRNDDRWFKGQIERLGLDFDFEEYEKSFDEAGYADDEEYAVTKPKKFEVKLSPDMLREFEFVSNYLRFPGSSKTMIISRAIYRVAALHNEKLAENFYLNRVL